MMVVHCLTQIVGSHLLNIFGLACFRDELPQDGIDKFKMFEAELKPDESRPNAREINMEIQWDNEEQ